MKDQTVVLAAGGSGGHIYPAIAVAGCLQELGYRVLFVGSQAGMEAEIVPAAGYDFEGLPAGKWHRGRLQPGELVRALQGAHRGRDVLKRHRPALVIGFGGFASFPVLAAAWWRRLPIILHEQNVMPGRVTRWFSRTAHVVALASGEAARHLRGAKQIVEVGLPIRETRMDRLAARAAMGLPQRAVVTLVMGGSQGALALNHHVPEAFDQLPSERKQNLYVVHACGPKWRAHLRPPSEAYRISGYVDAPTAWSAADIAITRAGMSTIAEAAYFRVPLVMVPLPSAADDHQHHNAEAVELIGGGRVVPEAGIETLAAVWSELLDESNRARARDAIAKLARPGAAERLAQLADAVIHKTAPTTRANAVKQSLL